MTIWPPLREAIERPAYRSLARHIAAAIDSGELEQGAQLPTQRDLAWRLGLSVQTVSRAYEELIRSGMISGEIGRGTFVRAGHREIGPPYQRLEQGETVIDCSMLTPVLGEIQEAALSRTLAEIASGPTPRSMTSFRPRDALRAHVEAALAWLDRCGVRTHPDRVIPTNGSTPAMAVALMTAASAGDVVVTEALGHHTLPGLARMLGLRLVGLPIDAQGIRPESLDRACEAGPVRAVLCAPAGLGATAAAMGEERRARLCEIARRRDLAIIENDAWGPLEPKRPALLASLAPERTFYFTSLTKCMLPGLRIGWLVAPEAEADAARSRHLIANWMASALNAEIASRWFRDGSATRLLRWQRGSLARRNRIVARELHGLSYSGAPHGLHVWMPLPDGWDEAAFVAQARLDGVAVTAGSAFAAEPGAGDRGVRVCLGAPDERALTVALRRLARLRQSCPDARYFTI